MANLLTGTTTFNKNFPGLNQKNFNIMQNYVKGLGLNKEEEEEEMNRYYRNNVNTMVNNQKLDERDKEINNQAYQAANIKSKDADVKLRVTELSQRLKRKYNLDASVNDEELFNDFVDGLGDEGKKLVGQYLAGNNKEILYKSGLENIKEKATDVAVGIAQSPGKWGYNIIGQWIDRAGKTLADKLQGSELQKAVQELAVDMFGEEEVKRYQQEKAKQLEEGTAFNGRTQTDIRTPILGETRAENGYTKAGEIAGDIATGIALTAPLATATAPMYASSTIGGAAALGSMEGILDAALVKYGSTGESPTAGDLVMGGITGAAGGLFSRYLQNLPKNKTDSIRKEAEEYINKSIKPTVKGKMSQADYNKYIDDTLDVTNFMDKNKGLLQYTDDAGEKVTGKLPTNMRETSETLSNLKKTLYDAYNNIAKEAGEKGARVNMNKAFGQLDDLERDVSQNIANPQTKSIIDNFKKALLEYTDDAGTISIEDAQKLTQDFNKQLTAFFKNPNMNDVSKNSIVAQLNKWTKEAINESLDDVLDEGITKGGNTAKYYSDLKGMYGKIKTIEDEVSKRALVEARKNSKGLSQTVIDSLAGGEFTDAILTANVGKLGKAAIMKTIGKYYKYINDPDVQLNNLFKLVQETNNPGSTQGIIQKGINTVVDNIPNSIKQQGKGLIKPNVITNIGETLKNN